MKELVISFGSNLVLWRILTWCSRKQAQDQHIHALTMSRPGIHCVETQSLVFEMNCTLSLFLFHITKTVISSNVQQLVNCTFTITLAVSGCMVPFHLRVLLAELPLYLGKTQESLDRLYYIHAVIVKVSPVL